MAQLNSIIFKCFLNTLPVINSTSQFHINSHFWYSRGDYQLKKLCNQNVIHSFSCKEKLDINQNNLYGITLGWQIWETQMKETKDSERKKNPFGAKQYPTRMVNFMKAFLKRSQTFCCISGSKITFLKLKYIGVLQSSEQCVGFSQNLLQNWIKFWEIKPIQWYVA